MTSDPSINSSVKSSKENHTDLTAEQVATYLKKHPEFFVDRDNLLAEITLPHESGKAISLLERQVKILRERTIESRHTLNTLLENAKYNDQLFNVTRALIIALLMEDEVAQIASATEANLCTQPGIDACSVILFQADHLKNVEHARQESAEFLQQSFPTLLRDRRTQCRAIDRETAAFLFPHGGTIRSAALCPIGRERMLGVLAIGNKAQEYFNSDLDTMFLDFIGEVLESVIVRKII
ncbi:MAG: DUF484 family protein [Gammaproteobacteria bacterium]|nr:DUF484 family protein [Gammaproteobacteria bacterium]MDP2141597.1 DUF484 family protein [Gammaproteobacteria bacterium]MDP2346648.1 DUF484 family protein [Gammaproteobacteria bacterium]